MTGNASKDRGLSGLNPFDLPTCADEAVRSLKVIGWWIAIIGGVHFVLGVVIFVTDTAVGSRTAIGGALMAILGLAIRAYRSRVVASAVALNGVSSLLLTLGNMLGSGTGGRNIILAIAVAAISVQAAGVTLLYHRFIESKMCFKSIAIKTVVAAVGTVFVGGSMLLLGIDTDSDLDAILLSFGVFAVVGASFAGWLPFTRKRPCAVSRVEN